MKGMENNSYHSISRNFQDIHFIFISFNETIDHIYPRYEVFISVDWLLNIQTDGKWLLRTKILKVYKEINMKIIVFTNWILSKLDEDNMQNS